MAMLLHMGRGLALAVSLIGIACCQAAGPALQVPQREAVVLLHGLARTHRSMRPMQRELAAAGYVVYSFRYPSREKTVERIVAEDFVPFLAQCQSNNPAIIHFVAHSLGNIVLRQYFAHHALTNSGRIVMLAPPSQGSEVVDKLGDYAPFDWVNGPAGHQLGTSSNSLPNRLPAPPGEFGVIAGTRSINWILSCLIPGPDDGKVSLERVKLAGAVDFATVKASHPFLMKDKRAIAMTLRFLQTGSFKEKQTTRRSP
jgi:pimeloyl-ACP methyl ester carboxylesterase